MGWTAGLYGTPASGLSRRRAGQFGVIALALVLVLALTYSFLSSLTILPFESVVGEDVGQPKEAFLPLLLPENMQELVREEGNRQAVVDRHKPGGVEFELREHEGSVFLTKAVLALLYGLVFAGLGTAGGLAVRATALVPDSGSSSGPFGGGIVTFLPRCNGSRPVAFISHSSKDRVEAVAVCVHLEKSGIPCWIAPRNIPAGADWSEAISEGIEACPVFLVLLSAAVNDSKHVVIEVSQAFSEKKRSCRCVSNESRLPVRSSSECAIYRALCWAVRPTNKCCSGSAPSSRAICPPGTCQNGTST
ncbi:MAG: toll/interleukin-1 receptor domain-containing protein [Verrucomicrobiae bacterium]|nr:toll/interleukin-1 receptor domain-containing protein [Verrucomicrobiae bacterium]